MKLVERFRTQPARSKHADPAVRLAYVSEIPLTDREAIGELARDDQDARVRRAAVRKLLDPARLGIVARDDPDETVRGVACSMLRDIALEGFEGVSEADSLDAVDTLIDARIIGQIAKDAVRETIARRALSRVTDAHLLGSIARHATLEGVRRSALTRLEDAADHSEIVGVALNSEYKDTALAALERVEDRREWEQIASRGKNKSAAKRARSMIREAEEQEEQVRAAAEDARRALEAAAVVATPPPAPNPVEKASPAAPPAEVEDPALAEQRWLRAEQDAAALREQEETARVRRQAAAEAAAEAVARDAERRLARLMELADVAAAAASESDLAAARARLDVAHHEWKDVSHGITVPEEAGQKLAAAEAEVQQRESAAREADARARREGLARLQHLAGRVEALPAKEGISLKALDRALADIRTALSAIPPLPRKQDADEIVKRLKAAQTTLVPKMQELREAVEWRRWANVTVQEQLCARMEALAALPDPQAIAKEVRELQEQWRVASDVPHAQADALWRRFKAGHDVVWPRCEAHFAAEAQVRAENLAKKIAICEKADALATSTEWLRAAEDIKQLQAEWKAVGSAGRQERALWERFRASCDRFFTRRRDDLAQRKTTWTENLRKKEDLCVRAEALADSTEWDQASAQMRQLQAEWKQVGPVKKTRSEAVWQRFHGACDRFFQRYADRHAIARGERAAAREAVCAELEQLASPPADVVEPPADLPAAVRALRSRWQQEIAAGGVDVDRGRVLDRRFAAALASVVARWPDAFRRTDLDVDTNRQQMESLVGRMEALAASLHPSGGTAGDAALSPATRLATMLKEALAANTIGGKVDDDSRFRAALEDVRHAQSAWTRIGMVPEDARRRLSDRFHKACRQVAERAGASAGAARARS